MPALIKSVPGHLGTHAFMWLSGCELAGDPTAKQHWRAHSGYASLVAAAKRTRDFPEDWRKMLTSNADSLLTAYRSNAHFKKSMDDRVAGLARTIMEQRIPVLQIDPVHGCTAGELLQVLGQHVPPEVQQQRYLAVMFNNSVPLPSSMTWMVNHADQISTVASMHVLRDGGGSTHTTTKRLALQSILQLAAGHQEALEPLIQEAMGAVPGLGLLPAQMVRAAVNHCLRGAAQEHGVELRFLYAPDTPPDACAAAAERTDSSPSFFTPSGSFAEFCTDAAKPGGEGKAGAGSGKRKQPDHREVMVDPGAASGNPGVCMQSLIALSMPAAAKGRAFKMPLYPGVSCNTLITSGPLASTSVHYEDVMAGSLNYLHAGCKIWEVVPAWHGEAYCEAVRAAGIAEELRLYAKADYSTLSGRQPGGPLPVPGDVKIVVQVPGMMMYTMPGPVVHTTTAEGGMNICVSGNFFQGMVSDPKLRGFVDTERKRAETLGSVKEGEGGLRAAAERDMMETQMVDLFGGLV